LAVLFLLMSVAAMLKLVVDMYINIKNKKDIRKMLKLKQNITGFTFLYNFSKFHVEFVFMLKLVRAIYFFQLPSGKIDSAVGDYILVALPTFFL
jgi:hypothetical protein